MDSVMGFPIEGRWLYCLQSLAKERVQKKIFLLVANVTWKCSVSSTLAVSC